MKSQDSHSDSSKIKLKPSMTQSSPTRMQSFSISARPKGSKPTARAKLPALMMLGNCPSLSYKAARVAGSQAERKQGRSLDVHILFPSPVWGVRRAQLLGWQAGNITPGHTVCCRAMQTRAMDSQCHQPSFTKQTTVKKGFHWHRHRPYAHSSSGCRLESIQSC